MLAKSLNRGEVLLEQHSHAVAIKAMEVAKNLLRNYEGPLNKKDEFYAVCYNAGILHDIGKSVSYYQNFYMDNSLTIGENPHHHQISYKIATMLVSDYEDEMMIQAMLHAILFHHRKAVIINSKDKLVEYTNTSNIEISNKDMKAIQGLLSMKEMTLMKIGDISLEMRESVYGDKLPTIYESYTKKGLDKPFFRNLALVSLIQADREVSHGQK